MERRTEESSSATGSGILEGFRDFFDPNNAGNFGPRRMREFLHLDKHEPLNSLNGRYPSKRVFCVVGTDWRDYRVGRGLASPTCAFSDVSCFCTVN